MEQLMKTGFFEKWTDPVSGIDSYILKDRVAPLQQSFYFLNSSFTHDGRYLWFYCAFPPSGDHNYGRVLGILDFREREVRCYPETQFSDASPLIDLTSGEAYWVSQDCIWKRGPQKNAGTILVNTFPQELIKRRRSHRISTHLTFSDDRKYLSIDAQIGEEWFLGAAPLEGGPVEIWQKTDRCYNHAQFSPVNPDLMLVAQDWWIDPAMGGVKEYENRMWLLDKQNGLKHIFEGKTRNHTHEWWDIGGKYVWYVDYEKGTEKVDITTGIRTNIWPKGTCHSHSDRTGSYLTGDIGTYQWDIGCRVAFFNTHSGKEVNIVTDLPKPQFARNLYHIDPHPQFCSDDKYICYTTTVMGYVTVALTRVEELIEKTK